jgi:hypothetical protein
MINNIPECSIKFREVPKGSGVFQEVPECSQVFRGIPVCSGHVTCGAVVSRKQRNCYILPSLREDVLVDSNSLTFSLALVRFSKGSHVASCNGYPIHFTKY